MNIQELIDYIYNNILFIDQHAPDLYRKVGLTKNLLHSLCTHPSPYHIPKARRRILYQLKNLIAARRQQVLGGSEEFVNEVIIEAQKSNHKRARPLFLRKRWMVI